MTKPLDRAEVEEGLRAEVMELPRDLRRYFTSVAVDVRAVAVSDRSVFVVAESGNRAIFYDGVEEDYGLATVDGDRLTGPSTIGELRSALLSLRDG